MPDVNMIETIVYVGEGEAAEEDFEDVTIKMKWSGSVIEVGGEFVDIPIAKLNSWNFNRDNTIISLTWPVAPDSEKNYKILFERKNQYSTWAYWIITSTAKHNPSFFQGGSGPELLQGAKLKVKAQEERTLFLQRKEKRQPKMLAAQTKRVDFEQVQSVLLSDGLGFVRVRVEDHGRGEEYVGAAGKVRGTRGRQLGTGAGAGGQTGGIFSVDSAAARSPSVVKVAVDDKTAHILREEARILAALKGHPNIIKVKDARAYGNEVCIFLEKGLGDMKVLWKGDGQPRPQPRDINKVALGALRGLKHIHKRRIYHMDIKPENIIIFPGHVAKLADFGLSRSFGISGEDFSKMVMEGTEGYKAPEWGYPNEIPPAMPQRATDIDLNKTDMYALGISYLESLLAPLYGLKTYKQAEKEKLVPVYEKIGSLGSRNKRYYIDQFYYYYAFISKDDIKADLRGKRLYALGEVSARMAHPNNDARCTSDKAWKLYEGRSKLNPHSYTFPVIEYLDPEKLAVFREIMDTKWGVLTGKVPAPVSTGRSRAAQQAPAAAGGAAAMRSALLAKSKVELANLIIKACKRHQDLSRFLGLQGE